MAMPSQAAEPGGGPEAQVGPRHRARPHLGRLGRRILRQFTLFAIITLLIMIGVTVYAVGRQWQDAWRLQEYMARWTANSLDNWFVELDNNLAAAARDATVLDSPALAMQQHLSELLLRNPAFRSATLVDARAGDRGLELMTLVEGNTSSGANLSQEEWFDPALERGSYISQVKFVKGMPMVTLARAIKLGGEAVGVIAAQADLSWAYSILSGARTDRGGYAYVVDKTGQPVLHVSARFVISHEARTDIVGVRAAISGQTLPLYYYYKGLNEQGQPVLGVYRKLERIDLVIIAEQPLPALIREMLPLVIGAGSFLLVSAIAAIVTGLFISRRVARPIMVLREGAQRIGTGNVEHRIALEEKNELGDLAGEFNRAADSLGASQSRLEAWSHELEARVAERTAELSKALQQLQEEDRVRQNLLRTIREMSSPVIPVMNGIIVMPIVGTLDSERAQRVIDDLLSGVEREKARVTILDITGLAVVDTAVANALLQAARAAQLLGAEPILVGISPEVAETLVQLGVDLRDLRTAATLQEGLRAAMAMLRRQVVPI